MKFVGHQWRNIASMRNIMHTRSFFGQHARMPKKCDNKFYEILGVSTSASDDEIKSGFRKAAMENHPDKGGDEEKVLYKRVYNMSRVSHALLHFILNFVKYSQVLR